MRDLVLLERIVGIESLDSYAVVVILLEGGGVKVRFGVRIALRGECFRVRVFWSISKARESSIRDPIDILRFECNFICHWTLIHLSNISESTQIQKMQLPRHIIHNHFVSSS